MEDIELLNFDGNVKEFRRNQLEELAAEVREEILKNPEYGERCEKLYTFCDLASRRLINKLRRQGIKPQVLHIKIPELDLTYHIVVGVPIGRGKGGFIIDPTITQFDIEGQCVFETNKYPFEYFVVDHAGDIYELTKKQMKRNEKFYK